MEHGRVDQRFKLFLAVERSIDSLLHEMLGRNVLRWQLRTLQGKAKERLAHSILQSEACAMAACNKFGCHIVMVAITALCELPASEYLTVCSALIDKLALFQDDQHGRKVARVLLSSHPCLSRLMSPHPLSILDTCTDGDLDLDLDLDAEHWQHHDAALDSGVQAVLALERGTAMEHMDMGTSEEEPVTEHVQYHA